MAKQSCGTCKWLEVKPDRDGKRRVRKSDVYRCVAPIPACPLLPQSVNWNGYNGFKWPPETGWMSPERGHSCPTYEQRQPQSANTAQE
jgi:hypothetical protein